jgi:hypothetical protein
MHGGMMGGMMSLEPEVEENRAAFNMIRCHDEEHIVTFLATLSDGYSQR